MANTGMADNGDGTYVIVDPTSDGDWLIYDTGEGWVGVHPEDSWEGARFATAADVAAAILGDPASCAMWGGGTYAGYVAGVA